LREGSRNERSERGNPTRKKVEAYHRDFGSAANGVLLNGVKQGSEDECNESSGA